VTVQGDKAAGEVAAAIEGFNKFSESGPFPRPDVLIVARGGGSIEDLWAFNEEIVVRAAAASAIPLISAVGHETDTTLIDFASDRRAPTPTAAAEMAVPVRSELLRVTQTLGARLDASMLRRTETARQRLRDLGRALPLGERLFEVPRQRLDTAAARLGTALALGVQKFSGRLGRATARLSPQPLLQTAARYGQRIVELQSRSQAALQRRMRDQALMVANAGKMLETLSHKATLARGFALVRDEEGKLVRDRDALVAGQVVSLTFAGGDARARIEESGGHAKQKAKLPAKRDVKAQGDLF
jgi:exodeoxyribonuclease VII large subunit